MTADPPIFFMRWVYHNAMLRQLRDQILGFVGIKPTRFTHFSGASNPKPAMIERWIAEVKGYGTIAS